MLPLLIAELLGRAWWWLSGGIEKGSSDQHLNSTYVLDMFSDSLGELSTCIPVNFVHTKLCALSLDGAERG